jgi:fructokinase
MVPAVQRVGPDYTKPVELDGELYPNHIAGNVAVFISCGDALVDLFSQPASSPGDVSLAGHVGGSPLNVALGLARLGNQSAFFCKNSTDFIGQRILQYLQSNNVDTQWVIPSSLNSTLAMVQTNEDGSASYAFYTNETADVSLLPADLPPHFSDTARVLHFASYSTAVKPTSETLLSLAQRDAGKVVISYDPNIRPSIEPDMDVWREKFQQFSSIANFIKASDEDIQSLSGSAAFDEWAADRIAAGADLVAVTEGAGGATLYAADGRQARSNPLTIDVADTVGAGDTFQAACLHFLGSHDCLVANQLCIDQIALDELVNFAARAAAITCTRQGADLPTLADVQSW